MNQIQKVDPTVIIEPATLGDKKGRWEKSSEIPFDFTDMGAAIKVADNAKFEKVKPWGDKAKNPDGTDADMIDPEVYFTFAFLLDKDLELVLKAICIGWRQQ